MLFLRFPTKGELQPVGMRLKHVSHTYEVFCGPFFQSNRIGSAA